MQFVCRSPSVCFDVVHFCKCMYLHISGMRLHLQINFICRSLPVCFDVVHILFYKYNNLKSDLLMKPFARSSRPWLIRPSRQRSVHNACHELVQRSASARKQEPFSQRNVARSLEFSRQRLTRLGSGLTNLWKQSRPLTTRASAACKMIYIWVTLHCATSVSNQAHGTHFAGRNISKQGTKIVCL